MPTLFNAERPNSAWWLCIAPLKWLCVMCGTLQIDYFTLTLTHIGRGMF